MSEKRKMSGQSPVIVIETPLSPEQCLQRLQQPVLPRYIDVTATDGDADAIRISVKYYPVQKVYFRMLGAVATGEIQRWRGTDARIVLMTLTPDALNPVSLAFMMLLGGFIPFLLIILLMPSIVLKLFWGLFFIGVMAVLPLQIQRYRQEQTAFDIEQYIIQQIGDVYDS